MSVLPHEDHHTLASHDMRPAACVSNRLPPSQVFFFTYEVDAPSVSRVLPETPGEAQTQLRVQEMSADLR